MLRIHFKDEGQDILWWDIDEDGVVRACNMQEWVWKDTKVADDIDAIQPGVQLLCQFPTGTFGMFVHPIEKVETVEEGQHEPLASMDG